MPLVGFNNTATDGEGETVAAQIQTVEGIEDAISLTEQDARTMINDPGAKRLRESVSCALVNNIQGYEYLCMVGAMANGIFDQIIEDAFKLDVIGIDEWQIRLMGST